LGNLARMIQLKFGKKEREISKIFCEFASHIYPGNSVKVELKNEGNRIIYQAKSQERLILKGSCEFSECLTTVSSDAVGAEKLNITDVIRKSISRMTDEVKLRLAKRVSIFLYILV
jgi:hypothetical protein